MSVTKSVLWTKVLDASFFTKLRSFPTKGDAGEYIDKHPELRMEFEKMNGKLQENLLKIKTILINKMDEYPDDEEDAVRQAKINVKQRALKRKQIKEKADYKANRALQLKSLFKGKYPKINKKKLKDIEDIDELFVEILELYFQHSDNDKENNAKLRKLKTRIEDAMNELKECRKQLRKMKKVYENKDNESIINEDSDSSDSDTE